MTAVEWNADLLTRLLIAFVSVLAIIAWLVWARANPRYVAVAVLPVGVFLLTGLFNYLLIVTRFEEILPHLYTLLSASLRGVTVIVFGVAPLIMLWLRKRDHD